MTNNSEEISNQQRKSWDAFSPGWKKWDSVNMPFLEPIGAEIIRLIEPKESDIILDLASGTGEPALTIAEITKQGKVIAMDISEGMLSIAKEQAALKGIHNLETKVGDASELPFEKKFFDAVSCRMGFMFFPDIQKALEEIHRVLKPGGRLAISVWGPPQDNFWVTVTMETIQQFMQVPPPPKEEPGMFRCAEPEFMTKHFLEAGFQNLSESTINTALALDAQRYWQMITEVGAPIVAALNKADESLQKEIKAEVLNKIHKKFPEGDPKLPSSARIIVGKTPV